MATSFHPSEIQYVSDPSIQLQSMKHNDHNQLQHHTYQDTDTHGFYQNGGYANGSSSEVMSAPQPSTSSDHEIDVTEEEEVPVRTRIGPPKDFLWLSVGIMILFCSPIAITAVQSAKQCRKAISMHNMAIADVKSEEAKGRAFLAILCGIASWVLLVAYITLGVID